MNEPAPPVEGANDAPVGPARNAAWLSRWRGLSVAELVSALGISGVASASLTLLIWSLAHRRALAGYLRDNQLPIDARAGLLRWLGLSTAAGVVLGAVYLARRLTAGDRQPHRWAHQLAPLMLVGLLPSFFCWRAWSGRELEFGILLGAYGFAIQRSLVLALEARGAVAGPPAGLDVGARALARIPAWATLATVLIAAAGYAAFFGYHTIAYHRSVLTLSWDLGLEDNLIWNVLHGGPFMKSSPLAGPVDSSHFGYHATLFAYVIAPFYALWPRAELLLLLQAVLIAAAAVPLYLFAQRHVGRGAACLIALAYLLYPAVHGANLYDFHYLPIGVVLLWSTLYCIDSGRYVAATFFALLTLSIREDMAADLAVMAGFIVLSTPRVRAGLILGAVSGVYFAFMKGVVMPRFMHGGESFIWQWQGLAPAENQGFSGVLMSLIGNPLFALQVLFERQKLLYFVQLATPLAFFPWRRGIGFYLMIPGLIFTLLTVSAPPLIQISFQYTAHWVAFLFVAVVVNLERVSLPRTAGDGSGPARRVAWLGTIASLTLIASYQYGAILQQHTVRGGFDQYEFGTTDADRQRYAALRGLIDQVPPLAKIASSEYVVPHVSNRPDAYSLRLGLYDAEYVLFELAPRYATTTAIPRKFARNEAKVARQALSSDFGVVEQRGPFVLAQRGHPADGNADVLAQLR